MLLVSLTTTSLLTFSGTTVPQDVLRIKGSREALRGSVTTRTADKVVFNPYFSTHAAMKWGVVEYAAAKVKSVRKDIPPREEFWIRFAKQWGSVDELCRLAEFCKKHRLKNERLFALEAALRLAPTRSRTPRPGPSSRSNSSRSTTCRTRPPTSSASTARASSRRARRRNAGSPVGIQF